MLPEFQFHSSLVCSETTLTIIKITQNIPIQQHRHEESTGKGKSCPMHKHHIMKMYRGCGGKALHILNLGTNSGQRSAFYSSYFTYGEQ